MALNDLFHRHQVSLIRAAAATSKEARLAHEALAKGYADRILALRIGLGGAAPQRQRVS